MEAVLERIAEYRIFLIALFSVWYRERPIIKPGVDEALLIARCNEALALLPYKRETVLRQRFGLKDGQRMTQSAIGQELYPKVTKQRVCIIEREALRKLRHPTRSRGLREFINYEGGISS